MTKTTLLAATALSALVFAGAANAQVITNVTISGQSRAQNGVTLTYAGPPGVTSAVTAVGTTAAAVADASLIVASESQTTLSNRTTTSVTSTTGRYLSTGGATAANQVAGLLGGNTYQVTLTLSSGTGVNARFSNSVPASAFSFLNGAGAALPAGPTADCDASDITGATIVSGGAANDTSVTVQFAVAAGTNCDGTTAAKTLGGVTVVHPFVVDAFGTVGVALNTALTLGAGYTAPAVFTDVIGTAAQRSRAAVVTTNAGYTFTAGGVANAAAGASAVGVGASNNVDQLLLGTTAPAFRTFGGANDGIGVVNFGTATQTGANTAAFVGFTGLTVPAVTYDITVTPLNGVFGTTVNNLRPGPTAAGPNPVGTYTVPTGGATASLAAIAGGTATTVAIGQGAAGTPTASLATVDQGFTIAVTPATASAGLVTLPGARSFTGQSLVLEGTSFRAPWMNSSVTGYNTVLRISNSGTRAVGPVELTLTSPNTSTGTSASVCRSSTLPSLASIAINGELSINSANLTACFGEFRRGDVTVRILDTVPASSLTAKLRIVNPDGSVGEQSLNSFSGAGAAAAPF